MATPPYSELRATSDEKLIEAHDNVAKNTAWSVDYFLNELSRREQARQTDTMLKLTRWIFWLTVVVTLATVLNLIAAFH
jgi:hypothetical protein